MEEVKSAVEPQPTPREATDAEVAALFAASERAEAMAAAIDKDDDKPEDGLEIFGPEPETLTTSIGDLNVGPMNMERIAVFLKVADKLLPAIKASLSTSAEINLTSLMTADPESLFAAVAVAADTTPDRIKKLYPEEFIRVATKVIVVNVDFFIRVLPMALGMAQANVLHALTKLAQAGPTLSKN